MPGWAPSARFDPPRAKSPDSRSADRGDQDHRVGAGIQVAEQ
jgi:hypothetical protein